MRQKEKSADFLNQYELEEYETRIMDQINRKYNSVMVFYGNDEYQITGTTKITRNIFLGTQDRNENAILFLENLDKIKQNKHMNAAFNLPKRARSGVTKGGLGASSLCGMSMISNDTAVNRDEAETSTIRQLQDGYNS